MNIVFNKYHTGNEIIKALSSISGYKTKVFTQTEVFDEELGIIPEKVKIRLTSILPDFHVSPNAQYFIFIIIDNIFLTYRYYVIDMQVNYLRNTGTVTKIKLLNDNGKDLTKKIETVIRQFLKNLNRK